MCIHPGDNGLNWSVVQYYIEDTQIDWFQVYRRKGWRAGEYVYLPISDGRRVGPAMKMLEDGNVKEYVPSDADKKIPDWQVLTAKGVDRPVKRPRAYA